MTRESLDDEVAPGILDSCLRRNDGGKIRVHQWNRWFQELLAISVIREIRSIRIIRDQFSLLRL